MPEMVCSIRADEITRSPLHTAGATHEQTGYALRFPRFVQYRTDKSASEATTVHEVERLFEDQK
jgi:DNA ligase-1